MRISDWSSDVCSSDLLGEDRRIQESACCHGGLNNWHAGSVAPRMAHSGPNNVMQRLHIAIVGYGTAGQAATLTLARYGHRVEVVEQAAALQPEHGRASCRERGGQ